MRITGSGIWGEPKDRGEAIAVVRRAVELGVNFIDTADSYGPDVSELILAEALHPYAEGLKIGTKAGFTREGPNRWTTNGRPDYLRERVDGSLKKLRVERLDLLQLHRIDPKVPAEDQFGVLADLQREGKVGALGLSEVECRRDRGGRPVLHGGLGAEPVQPDRHPIGRRVGLLHRARHRVLALGADLRREAGCSRRSRGARRPSDSARLRPRSRSPGCSSGPRSWCRSRARDRSTIWRRTWPRLSSNSTTTRTRRSPPPRPADPSTALRVS